MARENGWGAPRVHGELLKLGFKVSERTVSRYMRRLRRSPERRQSWLTFLRNHREVIVAMDFFTVPTVAFRILYVWFAIRHSRREIVHWGVTDSPTVPWVVQQLRETFPFEDAGGCSRYLVLDRDTIFSAAVVTAIESMGLEPTRTPSSGLDGGSEAYTTGTSGLRPRRRGRPERTPVGLPGPPKLADRVPRCARLPTPATSWEPRRVV